MVKVYVIYDYDEMPGVYSTMEKAEDARMRFGGSLSIAELDLDEMPPLNEGRYGWHVEIKPSGEVVKAWNINVAECPEGIYGRFDNRDGNPSFHRYRFECLAATKDEAIEIAKQAFEKYAHKGPSR